MRGRLVSTSVTMLRTSVLLSFIGAAVSFTAPMALAPGARAPAMFNTQPAAFAAVGPALPVFGKLERTGAMEALQMSCTTARTTATKQQPCRKKCMLLEKRANNAMSVSFSHIRTHKMQEVNLQWKRVWWVEGNSFVRLRLSTKAIKTLKNKPLQELASRVGLDLGKYRSR